MKKLTLLVLLASLIYPLFSQVSKSDKLQDLEKNSVNTVTATIKTSTRLFENVNDLTSVIMVIPKGSTVTVLGSDSTYMHVSYEDSEGYIYRRHAVIDPKAAVAPRPEEENIAEQEQPVQQQQISRFAYLENKYGSSMAARIYSGKIWKGMNSEMIKDSWGRADKISREISGNTVKEEWIYNNTWLYLENNTLMEWGPVMK